MTPEDLQTAIAHALATAADGLVAQSSAADIDMAAPQRPGLGDWSTSAALRFAATSRTRPELAAHLCTELRTLPEVASAEIAGPGFVNVTLTPAARAQVAFDIVAASATSDSGGAVRPLIGGRAEADHRAVLALQRSYAAACRERRRAQRAGISTAQVDASSLDHPSEARMLTAIAAVPSAAKRAGRLGDMAPFLTALLELGEAFEDWIDVCTITPTIDEDITIIHSSRLLALRAVIIVLAAGLRHMGASAPERI